MEQFKKKNLKFNHLQVRRETTHAETLKKRESSRFKRLSILRSIDESFEKPETQVPVPPKPVSRLERLKKWQQEKLMRKQLEMKNTAKPFYAGSSSLKNTSNKATSSQMSRMRHDSKLAISTTSSLTSRISNNSKLVTSSTSNSTIPCNPKLMTGSKSLQASRIPGTSKLPGYIPRAGKGSKEIAAKSIPEVENKAKTNGALPKTKLQTGIPASSTNRSKEMPTKGIPSRIQIGKPISSLPKRIPTQSRMPVSVGNLKPPPVLSKKPVQVSRVDEKKTLSSKENLKKGRNTPKELADKVISKLNEVKKPKEEKTEDASKPDNYLSSTAQLFECDVSMIKSDSSFAPANFKFVPPADLFDYALDDDVQKRIKEILGRTSTPSKPPVRLPVQDIDDLDEPSCNNDPAVCEEVSPNLAKTRIIQEEKLTQESDIQLVSDENLPTEKNKVSTCELQSPLGAVSISSPLETMDLNKTNDTKNHVILKFEDEELQKGIASEGQEPENKLIQKRPSMLRRSVLNSIAESEEGFASPRKTNNKENNFVITPRRSQRLSKLITIDESPTFGSNVTPRRSMRLHCVSKKCQFEEKFVSKEDSVFGSTRPKTIPFKDLKTRGSSHTNITSDFEKLNLEEMNPEDFLCDLDDTPEQKKTKKKVSLLYSPEKRKSTRRSIRGDLMYFSPVNNV